MYPKTIFVVRHTTPLVEQGICYGQTDLLLADSFQQETNIIKSKLNGFQPEFIISSHLQRCSQLANNLFKNEVIKTDARLSELNFGDWEMIPWNLIDTAQMNNWSSDFYHQSPPNGESFENLNNRTLDAWHHYITKNNSNKIAVVTHSGNIRCLLMHHLQIPYQQIFNLQMVYGAVLKIVINSPTHSTVEFI